ncbi:hypothetical protein ACIBHX_24670 [Nonomuraea sp. NPDC050536]|uniref:hypothetical protein n=1 Tax=Nonomuraea sp. NPDC050536 TaxID=3364366 RepID=UPI0037CA6E72
MPHGLPPEARWRLVIPLRFLLALPYLLFALPLSKPVAAGAAAVTAQYLPAGAAMTVMAVASLAGTAALNPGLRPSNGKPPPRPKLEMVR